VNGLSSLSNFLLPGEIPANLPWRIAAPGGGLRDFPRGLNQVIPMAFESVIPLAFAGSAPMALNRSGVFPASEL
jgi:hypothetical protein